MLLRTTIWEQPITAFAIELPACSDWAMASRHQGTLNASAQGHSGKLARRGSLTSTSETPRFRDATSHCSLTAPVRGIRCASNLFHGTGTTPMGEEAWPQEAGPLLFPSSAFE